MKLRALAASAAVLGCGRETAARPATLDSAVTTPAPSPHDSLVLSSASGIEVWFTFAREDRAADSTTCRDRGIEIRRGSSRTPVPLLYTEEAPRFVDDSTIEAVLYRACRPVDRYRVDVRTGQPTPVRAR